MMEQKRSSLNLAFLVSGDLPNAYSATFLNNQIERLPANISVLYGGGIPNLQPGGRSLFQLPLSLSRLLFKRTGFPPLARFQRSILVDFLKKKKIHASLAQYGTTGAMVVDACNAAGVPLIVHFHGFDAYMHSTLNEFKSDYKKVFHLASAIVAVSNDMVEQLVDLGAPREKVHKITCGIDTSLFTLGDAASAPPVFLQVGRFVEKKAPHLTLSAFKQVVEKVPDARLVMVGDGPLLDDCKQQADKDNIASFVEFTGVLPPKEVAQKMASSRVYVQHSLRPSNGDSEGTPVAVLEAGASGLPVVATRHAGIKDAVLEGVTGFLVDERDVDGMARSMIQLALNPDLAGKLGRAAREQIGRHYNLDKQIQSLWNVIENAVQQKASS